MNRREWVEDGVLCEEITTTDLELRDMVQGLGEARTPNPRITIITSHDHFPGVVRNRTTAGES